MGSSFNGFVLDPSKCSKLTMEEKQELLCEISKWSEGAAELLQSWTRREILEVICATMGKERKYTGRPKSQMIEHLLRLISEKRNGHNDDSAQSASPPKPESAQSASPPKPESTLYASPPKFLNAQGISKRQRKTGHPSRLAIDVSSSLCCQNLACRATLSSEDTFCKRCSCCICHKYDDSKDPSLWLVCDSEPADPVDSCGMSCHLECALKHERAGIASNGNTEKLDGAFFCISCGKVNELIGSWRKQLIVAKDTRRVDTLCHRLSLCHKLLYGTIRYQKLHEIVDLAAKKLEKEVGTLDGSHIRMAHGIVNRLSCGSEVQNFCVLAIEAADTMHSTILGTHSNLNSNFQYIGIIPPKIIQFEEISPTSIEVSLYSGEVTCCMIWHRKFNVIEYPSEPTCELSKSERRFYFQNLNPATEYHFRIVALVETTKLGSWEIKCATSLVDCDATEDSSAREAILNRQKSDGVYDQGKHQKSDIEDPDNLPCCEANGTANHQTMFAEITQDAEPDAHGDPLSSRDGHLQIWVPPTEFQNVFSDQTSMHQNLDGNNCDNRHSRAMLWTETAKDSNLSLRNGHPPQSLDGSHFAGLPSTPCKLEVAKDTPGRKTRMRLENEYENSPAGQFLDVSERDPRPGSSSKKGCSRRIEERSDRILPSFMQLEYTRYSCGSLEGDYEYRVKVIRRLECEGHITKDFRLKFLTWFSLRATPQERRIVSVFVDTLIDDPAGLAGQLVDTFSGEIWSKGSTVPESFRTEFCHINTSSIL